MPFAPNWPGSITVIKETVPAGSPQSFDYTSDYGDPFSLTDGQSNNSGGIPPGIYSVAETPVSGWTTTTDVDPTNLVVVDEEITVTFTNTQLGRIIVIKATSPPNVPQVFTFIPSWSQSTFTLTDGQSNNSGYLSAGTYSVSETPVDGWTTTWSQDPTSIVLANGQTITITATNTEQGGQATGCGHPLWRSSAFSSTAFNPLYNVTPGDPKAVEIVSKSPLALRLMPPPMASGVLDLLTVKTGPSLDPATGVLLGILDNLSPAIKWKAMVDLLSRDGPARDLKRAAYCEQRYQEYVELARMTPVVVQSKIQGVNCQTGAVEDADSFIPDWQCPTGTPTPKQIVTAGLNIIAPCPVQNDPGPYSVTLDVVRNADIPVSNAAYVQVGREHLEPILEEAESLAQFKCGGNEALEAMDMHVRFLQQAAIYNETLRGFSTFIQAVQSQSLRHAAKAQRRDTDAEALP